MDKVQISVVLTYCLYFNKANFHTCEGTSRESDIESPVMGQGHFKGNETQGQTSGNTVIMVLKEHKFLLSSINKNL